MRLFIVESPGKIKTIQSFLPRDFLVKASVGHCYQIERSNNSIDVDNNYKCKYVVIDGKQKVVDEISKLSKEKEKSYLKISYLKNVHLTTLTNKIKTKRAIINK